MSAWTDAAAALVSLHNAALTAEEAVKVAAETPPPVLPVPAAG